MTDYYELPHTRKSAKFVAWRISLKSNCSAYSATGSYGTPSQPCRYMRGCEGDMSEYYACAHPQAQGNNRGWLVACPGREEAK